MIGFGFVDESGNTGYDLRLQSSSNAGSSKKLIVASSPIQATLVQYSSDIRIKKDIEAIDEDSLLERIKNVRIRSYRYTDEWRAVRNDVPDKRVRGVIAQELAQASCAGSMLAQGNSRKDLRKNLA